MKFFLFLDAFGILLLQIPVEGGHKGAELTVRHELGFRKLNRAVNNGSLFYISASFFCCTHEISPITEGWSMAMSFHLKWDKPMNFNPRNSNLPAFVTNRSSVQKILNRLMDPKRNLQDDHQGSDVFVVPLNSLYHKSQLTHSNLKGKDLFMVNLLHSFPHLEIRLANAVYYRDGLANNNQQRNRNLYDEGCPDSEEDIEDNSDSSSTVKRFIEVVVDEYFHVTKYRNLNGEVCSENQPPIRWDKDFILGKVKTVFDIVGISPNREEYDCFHPIDGEPNLKQWHYKSIVIFWIKASLAVKCRSNFSSAIEEVINLVYAYPRFLLRNRIDPSNNWMRSRIIEDLHELVTYRFNNELSEEEEPSEGSHLDNLLSICNEMKLKEEFCRILRFYSGRREPDWLSYESIQPEVAKFIGLFGWSTCREFISAKILTGSSKDPHSFKFMISLSTTLLAWNLPGCVEAAAEIAARLFSFINLPTDASQAYEVFCYLISPPANEYSHLEFFDLIVHLDHFHLLPELTSLLMAMTTNFFKTTPILQLSLFALKIKSSIEHSNDGDSNIVEKITPQSSQLISILLSRFLDCDVQATFLSDAAKLSHWLQLFAVIEDSILFQNFAEKFCRQPPDQIFENVLLASLVESHNFTYYVRSAEFRRIFTSVLEVERLQSQGTSRGETHHSPRAKRPRVEDGTDAGN